MILGQRRLTGPDPCQGCSVRPTPISLRPRRAVSWPKRRSKEATKKGAPLLRRGKTFRQLAEESRAYIEGEIRDGKIAECQPSRLPGYNLIPDRRQIGVSLTPLTAQLADFFNAAQDSVLITEVRAGELSERAGLKGDCIVTVGGKTVKSTSDIDRLLNQESSGELEFVIVRDRSQRTVKIKLDQK